MIKEESRFKDSNIFEGMVSVRAVFDSVDSGKSDRKIEKILFAEENIKKNGAFTLSFATAETVVACDYVGIASANDVPDKFARAGFTATPSEVVNAPIINELPMAVECKLLKFNEDGICIGEIVNVSADESILRDDGKIDAKKLNPICYDSSAHLYWTLGEAVGRAFCDGKEICEVKENDT